MIEKRNYMQAHLAEWAQRNAEQSKYWICGDNFDCMFKIMASDMSAGWPPEIKPEVRAAAAAPLVKLALAERLTERHTAIFSR